VFRLVVSHDSGPEFVPEYGDNQELRPSTLATQEIRFAVVFTGGVNLAICNGCGDRDTKPTPADTAGCTVLLLPHAKMPP
jgi:hypothetical protein